MAVWRSTMADLVDRTRTLIGDPNSDGQDPNVDDLDLITYLDAHRETVQYMTLQPVPTITPSGTVYVRFAADVGDWEADATFVDGGWATVVPASSEWQAGLWVFAIEPIMPVRVSGHTYDLAAAGADALEGWAAAAARCYDMSVDGQQLQRSQIAAGLRESAAQLRMRARVEVGRLERADTVGGGW